MNEDEKWPHEVRAVKSVQLAFDLSADIQRAFRVSAAMQDMATPDMVRKVLGLPYKRGQLRPRLTLTLQPEDFDALAQKYQLDATDQLAIKKRVSEELMLFARQFMND